MSAVFVCSYMDGERRTTIIDDPAENKRRRVHLVLPQVPAWLNSAPVDFTIRGPSSGIRELGSREFVLAIVSAETRYRLFGIGRRH